LHGRKSGHASERRAHGLQARQYPAFHTAQGGEAKHHEQPLQRTDIPSAQRYVLRQISGAASKGLTAAWLAPSGRDARGLLAYFPMQIVDCLMQGASVGNALEVPMDQAVANQDTIHECHISAFKRPT
jgi:hypothetical protein